LIFNSRWSVGGGIRRTAGSNRKQGSTERHAARNLEGLLHGWKVLKVWAMLRDFEHQGEKA
jgi:hypothetical protein